MWWLQHFQCVVYVATCFSGNLSSLLFNAMSSTFFQSPPNFSDRFLQLFYMCGVPRAISLKISRRSYSMSSRSRWPGKPVVGGGEQLSAGGQRVAQTPARHCSRLTGFNRQTDRFLPDRQTDRQFDMEINME